MSFSNEQFIAFLKKNPLGIACAILSFFLAGFIYYRADLLPAVHAVLDEKSKEGERLTANVKYSTQLREQLDELVTAGKTVNSRLVNPSQLPSNLEYFYKLEADTNTRLLSLNPVTIAGSKPNPKSTFIPVGFTINVQGSYTQVLDFLHRLEAGVHYCRVLNSTYAKVGVEGDLLTLNLTVELLGQK